MPKWKGKGKGKAKGKGKGKKKKKERKDVTKFPHLKAGSVAILSDNAYSFSGSHFEIQIVWGK